MFRDNEGVNWDDEFDMPARRESRMGEGSREETAELLVDVEAEMVGVGMDDAASFGIWDAGLLAVEDVTSVMSP